MTNLPVVGRLMRNSTLSSLLNQLPQPAAGGLRRTVAFGVLAVVLAVLMFKLAISDGGRDPETLTLVQTAVFLLVALMAATGNLRDTPILRPLGAVVAAVGLTALWSIRADSSVRELLLWLMYLGIFLLAASTLTGMRPARRLVDAFVFIGGWLCLIGLYLFWGSQNPYLRWASTFYAPNAFAAFLLLVLPLAATRYCLARDRREAFDFGAMTVLVATALMLTFSRGAYLALAVTGILAVLVVRPASWPAAVRRAAVAAVLTALTVTILTHAPGSVVRRTASILDSGSSSIQDRLSFWQSGVRIFLDYPLVGTGPGTFAYAHGKYQGRYYSRDAHNLYVQTFAEMGVVGVAALVLLLGALGALWIRTLRKAQGRDEYPLIAGAGLSLAAFFLHSGVEMNWQFPANPVMAFALAGVLAWYDQSQQTEEQRPDATVRHLAARIAIVFSLVAAIAVVQILGAADREFRQGRQLVRARQWARASARFQRAMALNPLDPRSPSAQAVVIQGLQEGPDVALRLMERAAALDRMNPYYPLQMAEALLPQAQHAAVGKDVEGLLIHALDLDPFHYPEAYRRLAQLYAGQGRNAEAAAVYARAVSLYSARPVAGDMVLRLRLWLRVAALFSEAASFQAAQGRSEDAVGVLDTLLRQDPTWQPAYRQIADLYIAEKRYAEAHYAILAGWAELPDGLALSRGVPRLPVLFPRVYPR